MFRLASQDLRLGSARNRKSAKKFINSDWFDELCDNINLRPDYTRNMIINTKVRSRTNYD